MDVTIHEDIDGPLYAAFRERPEYCALEIRHSGSTVTIYGRPGRADAFRAIADLLSGRKVVSGTVMVDPAEMPLSEVE